MSTINKPSRLGDLVKRVVDIICSLIGLIILMPVFVFIAIWIKRDSPGPVFYRGARIGKGGRIFQILKFRTMVETPDSYNGPRVTARDDPRVTNLGRWLRDTKLNEFPQLWNVLYGEMSLVGPRPEDPEIAETWPPDVRSEVLSVRPGVTSPASVLYRNEESLLKSSDLMDTYLGDILPSKLRLDQLYVRHRGMLLDLDIIFWTFLVLIPRVGSGAPPEERVFLGPLSRLVQRYIRWFVIDAVATFCAIGITGVFWRSLGPLNVGWPKSIAIAFGFSVLYSLVGALLGVNRIVWSQAAFMDALDLLPPVGLATVIAITINFVWNDQPGLPLGMILMAAILACAGYILVRYRSRLIEAMAGRWLSLRGGALQAQERVLIVGGGDSGQFIAWLLQNGQTHGVFRIMGFVDDDLYKQDTRIRGVNVLGRREDIPALVARHDVGLILFAIHNIPSEERKRLLEICGSTPARVFSVPDILGSLRQVTNGGGNKSAEPPVPDENLQPDADNHIDSSSLAVWLAELDDLALQGDLQAVRQHIDFLRISLENGETTDRTPAKQGK